ncbi:hypothetical protein KC19_VG144100 [Ceratodon purpureus]|uniref:Uncharacterized protein n=1 Tax=Ceratodon purpureus TaxID=3225 RepID=A0A8T0HQC3_CERPU|nr:hypothetical protein KC19_VG144100 [Ceratodon purpureus]
MSCVQKCGHQELCFHYIEGRKSCPICDESIDGWEVLRKESCVSTHLQSLGGASDIPKDPLIATVAGRKKAAKAAVVKASKNKVATVKGPDVLAADGGLSTGACFSDSDDEGIGEQHWCGDEEFNEGGKRSLLPFRGQGVDLGKTELVPALHVEEDAVTEAVCLESHEDASEPERVVEECMLKKTSKGRAGRSLYVETLNHTRVIATDLLAVPPSSSASCVEKSATVAVSKGRRGRPTGDLKEALSIPVEARRLQERVYSRVRTAPSRLTL